MRRFARTETLRVTVERDATGTRIRVRGELDLATAPSLCEELEAAAALAAGPLSLDLAEVTFIDLAGMRALGAAAAKHGLAVERTSPAIRHLVGILDTLMARDAGRRGGDAL